ncbi:hypothetical protein NS376_12550, partial [Pseudomonas oryzihabitans]
AIAGQIEGDSAGAPKQRMLRELPLGLGSGLGLMDGGEGTAGLGQQFAECGATEVGGGRGGHGNR